jgi:hypothetical protein
LTWENFPHYFGGRGRRRKGENAMTQEKTGYRIKALLLICFVAAALLFPAAYFAGGWLASGESASHRPGGGALAQNGKVMAGVREASEEELPPGEFDEEDPDAAILEPLPAEKR